MKTKDTYNRSAKLFAACLTVLSILAARREACAQGGLFPPGPPAPTMKTLVQVEPRVDVQTLPGDPFSRFVISEPGSYYLTTNVLGAPGISGISIRTNNVTLDLNGFALLGTTGSLDGIVVLGPQNNIEIRSGNIENWAGDGVNTSMGTVDCRLVNIRSSRNEGNGFNLGQRSVITECQAATNRMNGIRIASGIVKNCTTAGNGSPMNPPFIGAHGIFVIGPPFPVLGGDIIKDCVSEFNYLDGINVAMAVPGTGASIVDCVTKGNFNDGIEVVNYVVVRGNHCFNNLVAGIHVSGVGTGNRIEDNHVGFHPTGYMLDPGTVGNLVIKNTSQANGAPFVFPLGNHIGAMVAFPGIGFGGTPWDNFIF